MGSNPTFGSAPIAQRIEQGPSKAEMEVRFFLGAPSCTPGIQENTMKKTQVVVIAVVKKNDKFLLTLRNDPKNPHVHKKWQLPGGAVEFGEHPEEALKREMKEELGIEVGIIRLIPKLFHRLENNWHAVLISYLCYPKHERIKLNEEATEYKWATKQEIKLLDNLGPVYELIGTI